jgi:predicted metal-binding membrane protein
LAVATLTPAEALLRRERVLVWLCLGLICLMSWWYLLAGAGTGMSTLAMTTWQFPPPIYNSSGDSAWPLAYWWLMILMWWVMMIAMMVPSAAPMILLYARVFRHNQKGQQASPVLAPTSAFLFGYLLAWLLFSVAASVLQWGLEQVGLVHGMMMWSNSHLLSAVFLLAAGAYQLSPLKNACLSHCRNPVSFLSAHWRKGASGALRMGVDHGLYCVGCCWFLMLLLFVGGIMNLVWIAGLAIFVLLEKLLPQGPWIARASGGLMLFSGAYLLWGQF